MYCFLGFNKNFLYKKNTLKLSKPVNQPPVAVFSGGFAHMAVQPRQAEDEHSKIWELHSSMEWSRSMKWSRSV
jgi:hypothetical protein